MCLERWSGALSALGLAVLACAAPASAAPQWLAPGIVGGVGVVGQNQYDNGQAKVTFAASVTTGMWRPHRKWSLVGLGVGFRASNGAQGFDEIGVVVPLVTFHKGAWITQAGAMVQRLNGRKHLWYLGTGVGFQGRQSSGSVGSSRWKPRSSAPVDELVRTTTPRRVVGSKAISAR
jgi:hypothetical protein